MIKYLIRKFKKMKYLFMITILFTLFNCFLNIWLSIYSSNIIDLLSKQIMENFLIRFCETLLIIFVINILILTVNNLLNFIKNKLQIYCSFNLNYELFEHLQKCSKEKWISEDSVYFTQRINADVNTLFSILIESGPLLIWNSTLAFISIAYFLFTMPIVISVVIFVAILMNLLVYKKSKSKILNNSISVKEAQSVYFSKMNLQLKKTKFIHIFNCQQKLYEKLNSSLENLYDSFKRFLFIDIKYTFSQNFIKISCQLGLNIIVGAYIVNGDLTLSSFVLANIFLSYVLNGINYFIEFSSIYIDAYACYERIIFIEKIKEDPNGNKNLNCISEIDIRNLSFAYENNIIFKNLSLNFKKGNLYVIKGANGRGKSTLLNLLLGVNNLDYNGEIYYDDENLVNLDKHSLYKNISFLPQDSYIFDGTVFENINLDGDRDIDRIDNLLGKFEVNFLDKLEFLNKFISYEKVDISGGELQKIMLIRALSKKSSVLIMDEPTNELDKLSEEHLLEQISTLKGDKIIMIVTHDHTFDEIADEVIYL